MHDGALGMGGVIADELVGSVDDHLRGVDTVDVEAGAVLILALGVLVGGEAVVPAEVVPVVDVLAEDDDFGVLDGLISVEFRQQRVSWRASRAALQVKSSTRTGVRLDDGVVCE